MSDPESLKLVAFASKADEPLIPPLEQVVILSRMLGYICELKLQHLPEKPFKRLPCPSPDPDDLDEGVESQGFDFLGRYENGPNIIKATLNICRIVRFCARHGLHREDVIKIVLIHELAHFVTHSGMDSGVYWEDFGKATPEQKEDFAQEATHLLLRVAGYNQLLLVFDNMSNHFDKKYGKWRETWKRQLKNNDNLDAVLRHFRATILKPRAPIGKNGLLEDEDWDG
jgi:hypothetical protein